MSVPDANSRLASAYRADAGQILAYLVSRCGNLQLAEDALHDACLQAEANWARQGVPSNPSAWLCTSAARRMMDRLRYASNRHADVEKRHVVDALTSIPSFESMQEIPDERLSLMFTCCHPALSSNARVALTLNALCGLSVREIARAFLVSEATMSQRLVRAKKKIRINGIPYITPSGADISSRLETVLSVIYLIFNESYTAFEGQTLTRDDLAEEAIRLARVLVDLFPKPEVNGLLALLLLHQARRLARLDERGEMVALEHQNRTLWDQSMIQEGENIVRKSLARGEAGPYQIQAAISAVHARAIKWHKTDWAQIIGLYRELLKYQPSAVARLNLFVAVAHSGEYSLAKRGIEGLLDELDSYQPFHVAMANINRKVGDLSAAKNHLTIAIRQTKNTTERAFLERQLKAMLSQ